jgi:hypothetical protein
MYPRNNEPFVLDCPSRQCPSQIRVRTDKNLRKTFPASSCTASNTASFWACDGSHKFLLWINDTHGSWIPLPKAQRGHEQSKVPQVLAWLRDEIHASSMILQLRPLEIHYSYIDICVVYHLHHVSFSLVHADMGRLSSHAAPCATNSLAMYLELCTLQNRLWFSAITLSCTWRSCCNWNPSKQSDPNEPSMTRHLSFPQWYIDL